jgi:hypothetical protein
MHRFAARFAVAGLIAAVSAPAWSQAPIPTAPAPRTATAVVGPPAPVVTAMDAADGMRASKIVGAAVYDDQDAKIGSVDDLIVRLDQKVSVAILSVGGFLGVGTKLVSVPYADMRVSGGKVVLPAATKDSLTALPEFSYAAQ